MCFELLILLHFYTDMFTEISRLLHDLVMPFVVCTVDGVFYTLYVLIL